MRLGDFVKAILLGYNGTVNIAFDINTPEQVELSIKSGEKDLIQYEDGEISDEQVERSVQWLSKIPLDGLSQEKVFARQKTISDLTASIEPRPEEVDKLIADLGAIELQLPNGEDTGVFTMSGSQLSTIVEGKSASLADVNEAMIDTAGALAAQNAQPGESLGDVVARSSDTSGKVADYVAKTQPIPDFPEDYRTSILKEIIFSINDKISKDGLETNEIPGILEKAGIENVDVKENPYKEKSILILSGDRWLAEVTTTDGNHIKIDSANTNLLKDQLSERVAKLFPEIPEGGVEKVVENLDDKIKGEQPENPDPNDPNKGKPGSNSEGDHTI